MDNQFHTAQPGSQAGASYAEQTPGQASNPLPMLLSKPGQDGTGRRGRGRRRKEEGVPAGICDRKRPCSEVTPLGGKSRKSSFQGPPESGKDRLTHFPLTRGMSQRGSSCRKPSPHCQSRTEALWEPGGQEVSEQPTPIPARPVPPLPLLTEHPPVATRSVLSRAATDDTQKGCSRPGSPCSP